MAMFPYLPTSPLPGDPGASLPVGGVKSRRRFDLYEDDRGPGLASITLDLVAFLLIFVALTPPSPYALLFWAGILAWFVALIVWLAKAWRAVRVRVRGMQWWRLLVFPLFLTLTIVFTWQRVPFRLAFAVSRGAMDQAASDVMSGKRDPAKIGWIGVYPVSRAYGDRYGFWFEINGTSKFRDLVLGDPVCERLNAGFSFNDAAATYGDSPLIHVSGPWWEFRGEGGCDCCGA